MSWSSTLAAVLAIAMTVASSSAVAQTSAKDASDHHRAGVAYAKSGKWADAVRELDEAYALDPSPIRLYDVAQVCLQAKQFVRARDAYARVADSPALTAEQRQRARAGLDTAKANVGRVRIAVIEGKPSDVVLLDGAKLHADIVDVDPGRHVVALVRDGASSEVAVDAAPGTEVTATIGRAPPPPPRIESPPPAPAPAPSGKTSVAGWIFTGIAIAAVGTGIPLIVIGNDEYAEIERDPCSRDRTCGGRDEPARNKVLAGDILIGTGVVAAAVAVYFFLTSSGKP